ncbi:signal peptide peptidase-like 2B isoform X2 [Silurus asotus]|uniref:Signal peptide peptidase-like 2B isoform X2 n=1 Tax=Silurus asotus TaxID=30991 RepID=A0AAD4ZYE6_SILAS|nr:signal peptide peptidase-like 2B isoform X2 [Silurus asotus]
MVMRGNCTFYEKVRLAQINGAKGLLIISKEWLSQFEEIDIPLALISYTDLLDIHTLIRESLVMKVENDDEKDDEK